MAKVDPRKLRAEAQDHVARGRLKKAVEVYLALEAAEPSDGVWPHKVGELMHKLGELGPAVLALGRAADRYARAGFLVKAIAVCKLVVRIDPTHREAADRIAALNQERGFGGGGAATASPAAAALAAGRPLDSAGLAGLGTRTRGVGPGVAELELDDLEIDLAPEAAGMSEAERARVRAALGETPFVAVLGEAALGRLVEAASLIELGAGEILFRQGDPGDTLYVIESGEVVARHDGPPARELGRLGEGAVFGEIALLTDQPRSATIVAAATTRLVGFDRRAVGEMLSGEPRTTALLIGFLRDRLLANLMASSPLFAPFSPDDRRALLARFRLTEAAAGAVLVEQGRRARGLAVILTGGAEVTRRDEVDELPVAVLQPGDVFGEISLLEGAAVATVRARARSLLLVLPADEFREIMMTHPHVLAFVADLGDSRKAALASAGDAAADLAIDLHLDFL